MRLLRTLSISSTLVIVPVALGACSPAADSDEATSAVEAPLDTAAAADELSFLRLAHDRLIAGASAAARPLGDADETIESSYYRLTCSLALVGAVVAKTKHEAPSPMVLPWIRAAFGDYRHFSEDAWAHHVKLAPAVDCALAASVAADWLAADDRRAMTLAIRDVADDVYDGKPGRAAVSPARYRQVGAGAWDNTQAEEAALGAAFFYLASTITGRDVSTARRAQYAARSEMLFRYAGMRPIDRQPWRGEPFRRLDAGGAAIDGDVVTNHGLQPSPYYSLGALLSYADATAVARSLRIADPPGIATARRTIDDGVATGEQLSVGDIVAGGLRYVDRTTFAFTGSYRLIRPDGSTIGTYDYAAQTQTIPFYPPGSELEIPTTGVRTTGTVSQFVDATGKVKGYQIDGATIRAFECANEARGWFCRALYKTTLASLFAGVAEPQRFGAPLPSSGIDAMPQWLDRAGTLHTEVVAQGRVWHYTCRGGTCTAVDMVDLGTHLTRAGFSANDRPPTIESASTMVHADGVGRRYFTSGGRIWRARCSDTFTSCSASSDTLGGQFAGLAFSPAIPTDRVDAMTQLLRGPTSSTYVFRDDRLWKYDCTNGTCAPILTSTLLDQWRGITNQERWADGATTVLRGVTDWGVQATMMNAVFAYANLRGVDGGSYAQLRAREKALGLAAHTLFPSTFDAATGRFGYGTFTGAYTAKSHGTLLSLQDGWEPRGPTYRERLSSYLWMNAFAGRNGAIAYMLASGGVLAGKLTY